jgi:hypothetical protein
VVRQIDQHAELLSSVLRRTRRLEQAPRSLERWAEEEAEAARWRPGIWCEHGQEPVCWDRLPRVRIVLGWHELPCWLVRNSVLQRNRPPIAKRLELEDWSSALPLTRLAAERRLSCAAA